MLLDNRWVGYLLMKPKESTEVIGMSSLDTDKKHLTASNPPKSPEKLDTEQRYKSQRKRITPVRFKETSKDGESSIDFDVSETQPLEYQMFESTGMPTCSAGHQLLVQAYCTDPTRTDDDIKRNIRVLNGQSEFMHAIGPQNGLEGMLAAQMVATHNMGMEFSKRAMVQGQPAEFAEKYFNMATKAQRTFVAQIEALNKLRTGGQQTIQVQHVQVNQGGQAVIGQQAQGGGGNETKMAQSTP